MADNSNINVKSGAWITPSDIVLFVKIILTRGAILGTTWSILSYVLYQANAFVRVPIVGYALEVFIMIFFVYELIFWSRRIYNYMNPSKAIYLTISMTFVALLVLSVFFGVLFTMYDTDFENLCLEVRRNIAVIEDPSITALELQTYTHPLCVPLYNVLVNFSIVVVSSIAVAYIFGKRMRLDYVEGSTAEALKAEKPVLTATSPTPRAAPVGSVSRPTPPLRPVERTNTDGAPVSSRLEELRKKAKTEREEAAEEKKKEADSTKQKLEEFMKKMEDMKRERESK